MKHTAILALGLALLAPFPTRAAEDLVYIDQSFDDTAVLTPGLLRAQGDAGQLSGGWRGQDDAAFTIVSSPCRSKPHALRIARVDTLRRVLLFRD